jgi:hypothetical protein
LGKLVQFWVAPAILNVSARLAIITGDEGTGIRALAFPTSSVGATYAFDMYQDGAHSSNVFQSATLNY